MHKNETTKGNVTITPAEIDIDVLKILGRDCAISAVEAETEMRRLELNCLCEMLSQFKKFQISLDEMLNILMVVGNEKIVDFFSQLRDNVAKEESAEELN